MEKIEIDKSIVKSLPLSDLEQEEINEFIEERFYINHSQKYPNDGISTLSWWCSLSAPETLRAMLAVA
jgi:hypothetical protein